MNYELLRIRKLDTFQCEAIGDAELRFIIDNSELDTFQCEAIGYAELRFIS